MRALLFFALLCAGCAVEPNGLWGKPDSGLAFFGYDGGAYWYPRDLVLKEIKLGLGIDCSSLTNSSPLEYSGRFAPFFWPLQGERPQVAFEIRDPFIDQGYRLSHRDAGTVGPVWLAFDAGVVFEGASQARFSWLATYLDDAGVVGWEGGEAVYEREDLGCQ